jgi:hypothetical protein
VSTRDSLLVPEGARLVHIGPQKTGSTAIQNALHDAKDRLAELGVHYAAGAGVRDRRAGWALGLPGQHKWATAPSIVHWERLVNEVAGADLPRVCVSNEDFGRAQPEQVRKIVDDLGGDQVHVVAVARRLDTYLPSQWQERIKAGERIGWRPWLRVVLGPDETKWNHRNVWQSHDTAALVDRWTSVVSPERFTLVIADETDRARLPRTFEELLGLPGGTLELQAGKEYRSLSWAEVELVRALNRRFFQEGRSDVDRHQLIRAGLVRELYANPVETTGPRTPPIPRWALEQLRELSRKRVEAIRSLDVRVVGDPVRLLVPDGPPAQPVPISELGLSVEDAAAAVWGVVEAAYAREARAAEARDRAAARAAATPLWRRTVLSFKRRGVARLSRPRHG